MSSRDKILQAIKTNKPALLELPVVDYQDVISFEDNAANFKLILERIGGQVVSIESQEALDEVIAKDINSGLYIINALDLSTDKAQAIKNLSASDLAQVERVYLKASIGVAENGSVWLNENEMVNRLLPFICQHLVIVLKADAIVPTMHHAYDKINVAETGFGSFIAGPSKTADIEQSLVIGAHGARSLVVYLMRS